MNSDIDPPLDFLPESMRALLRLTVPSVSETELRQYAEGTLAKHEFDRVQARICANDALYQRLLTARHQLYRDRPLPVPPSFIEAIAGNHSEREPDLAEVAQASRSAWLSVVWRQLTLGIRHLGQELSAPSWSIAAELAPTLGAKPALPPETDPTEVETVLFRSASGDQIRLVYDREVLRFYVTMHVPVDGPLRLLRREYPASGSGLPVDHPLLPTGTLIAGSGEVRARVAGVRHLVLVLPGPEPQQLMFRIEPRTA